MDEMYRQSADWPNWPEDPSGQMPVMQNSRQAVQATKTMRGIDTAGRRDIVRQLMSERANQRAAMAAGGAGIAAAGAAGASGGSAMFAPATTLGKDDEVRPQREEMYPEPEDSFDYGGEALGPVGPRPRGPSRMLPRVLQEPPATEDPLASRDPFAPRYNDEELDEPLREEMYPEAEATEDPFAAYDSRIREEMYPEPEDSFGYGGEALGPVGPRPSGPSRMQPYLPNADKPLSQGGFPSGLLRHLLTPPPQDRPSY
jgi:hypothetical protein